MPSWMIAFSLGIGLAGIVPELPAGHLLPLFLVLPLLSLRLAGLRLAGLRLAGLRLAGAFSLGLWWALLEAGQAVADLLPKALERQDIWVEGRVAGLPQRTALSQRFAFEVERWCPRAALQSCVFSEPAQLRRRILLNDYEGMDIAPGQYWRVKLRLKRPHGFANPGGFDYEAWLLQQRFSATGYIRRDPDNRLLREGAGGLDFQRLRHAFRERFGRLFPPGQAWLRQEPLILALSIGDRYGISNRQWDIFSATGTNHLMVISGLHISLAALLGYLAALRMLRLLPSLMLRFTAPRLGACAALASAAFYSGLAGFSLPVQRALIMALALMLGRLLQRQTSPRNSLCLALGLVLARDPLAPQNTGFWLSFGAVAVLVLLAVRAGQDGLAGWPARLRAVLLSQLGICLGLLPLMLVFFQQTSLLAPLSNLLAIPLVSLLVVPLCLAGLGLIWWLPELARPLFLLADRLLDLLMRGLAGAAERLPQAVLELPALSPPGLALLAGGVALAARDGRLRLLALAGFLPLLLAGRENLAPGSFRVHVLDVGQGLSMVVETAGHRLIYDTGPAYSPRFDAGTGVLLPFLRARNLKAVDTVVVSHGDSDHAGGLAAVVRRFPDARYLGGQPEIFPAGLRGGSCRAGQSWHWDGVDFRILHPERPYARGNDASCVLRISSGAQAVLLSGDIEALAERRLLRHSAGSLRADILIAPHHGSRSSSTSAFVGAVAPAWVVFSSGYLNRFNHPAAEVRDRYRRAGARALNTAHTGAISFLLTGEGAIPPPALWREERRRFWSSL